MSTWDTGTQGMTSTDAAAGSDPEVISQQIDHTRDAMAGTLDEIQRRLEPEQVSSYVKDVAYYVVLELKSVARDFASETMTNVRAKSSESTGDVSAQGSKVVTRLTEPTKAFLARYSGRQSGAGGKAGQEQMSNQAQGLWKKLEANPLALCAAGIAVGSLVGVIAPRMEQEDQIMGEARDHMMENLQSTAGQTVESIRTAATETGSAVLKEATSSQQNM